MLVEREGLWWPADDRWCLQATMREVASLDRAVALCSRRRTVIQAGGNCGVFPARLAASFERVVTFEPDAENFEALCRNTRELRNVERTCAALGDSTQAGGTMIRAPQNAGAHRVGEGDEFSVVTIDSLALADVDLMQLDIEGMEGPALAGAQATIERCAPVLMIEMKGLGWHFGYGWPDGRVRTLLAGWGYRKVEKIHADEIWQREES